MYSKLLVFKNIKYCQIYIYDFWYMIVIVILEFVIG